MGGDARRAALQELDETGDFGQVLWSANQEGMESAYKKYHTTLWCLLGLVLIPAYGVGLLLLLWAPVIWLNARDGFRARRFYVTEKGIVLRLREPVTCRCCGVNSAEKHLLHSVVTDVSVTQNFVQRWFGLHTIRVETPGQSRAGVDATATSDIEVLGLTEPMAVKAVLLLAVTLGREDQDFDSSMLYEMETASAVRRLEIMRKARGLEAGNAENGAPGSVHGQLETMNETLRDIQVILEKQNA